MGRRRAISNFESEMTYFTNDIMKMMHNRTNALNPFPLNTLTMYERVWDAVAPNTREEVESLTSRFPSMIRTDTRIRFDAGVKTPIQIKSELSNIEGLVLNKKVIPYWVPNKGNSLYVEVSDFMVILPTDKPIFDTHSAAWSRRAVRLQLDNFPEWHDELHPWIKRQVELLTECNIVEGKLNALKEDCNTFGQAYRLWPNLFSYAPDKFREKVNAAKAKSKLPESVVCEGELIEQWTRGYLEPFELLIAEASMLPTATHNNGDFAKLSFVVSAEVDNQRYQDLYSVTQI